MIIWVINERAAVHLDDLIFPALQIALDGECTPSLVQGTGASPGPHERGQSTDWAETESEITRCLNNPVLSFAAREPGPQDVRAMLICFSQSMPVARRSRLRSLT